MTDDWSGAAARRQAEETFVDQPVEPAEVTPEHTSHLIHELRVHQIELEMQNEELRRTQLELEASRDRYARLYDFAPVGYLTLSPNNVVLEANLTIASMLGMERTSLLNTRFSRCIHGEDQGGWHGWMAELSGTKEPRSCEVRLATSSGHTLHARLDGRHGDDPPATQLAVTDVSEQKRAEAARVEMERRLLHGQRLESLGVLAGGIAHDFNNLLTVILGRLDLALKVVQRGSPAAQDIRDAMQASKRAAELTRQMLDFSGKSRSLLSSLDLSQLLRENATLFRASIARTVEIRERLAPRLPRVMADSGQLQQVAMNLITNAAEAMGDRAGLITIATGAVQCDQAFLSKSRLEEKPAPGRYVYLEVADTGCGMDRDTLERLFDPFFTTKFLGRGLGMSAVMGIVRGHGGAILIDSEVGVGTTVRVLLPTIEEDSAAQAEPAQELSHSPGAWPASSTVLVADDEEGIRELCRQMLGGAGLRVVTASDGEEAVRVFRERATEISCVILDLTMPRMDGVTAFRELKRVRPDAKVILVSGYSELQAAQRFAGEGPAAFIQKPYLPGALLAKLRQIIVGGS